MGIYEEIQNRLTNKEVAKYYLGNPQQYSGDSIGYCSPFREEKHPSFWVNDNKGFTDFGAKEYSGNMINFVKQYRNLDSYYSAAKAIIKDFNLDIKTSDNMSCFVKNRKQEKVTDIVFDRANKTEKIPCMFDTIEHTSKPDGKEAASIKNRINKLEFKEYTKEEIVENILKGKTVIPAGIKSNARENFKKQSLFLVDFDNTKNGTKLKIDDKNHKTIKQVLDYCEKIKLMPTFVYETFSHTEQQHKFRLGYVLENPITDYKIASKIPKKLLEIFKDYNPDTSKQNLADFFYGGKRLAYIGENYYNARLLEGYAYEEEIEITDDPFKEYNDILRKDYYEFSSKGLMRKIRKQDEIEDKLISNFIAVPVKFINYDDGREKRTEVILKAIMNTGKTLPEIKVDINAFESNTWLSNGIWALEPRISPNGNNKEYFKDTVKILGKLAKTETIYSHMGFRKIKEKPVYLYHGGTIGTNDNIKVDLSESGLEQYTFSEETVDEKQLNECIETSLSLLNVSKETITVPLLGTIFLAPLREIFTELKIPIGFVTWILGESGSQKSTLAALFLSHFGNFERDTLPSGFKDTVNSLEKKCFIAKDTVMLVDDYFPSQSLQELRKMDAVAESIFGMAGDRLGRSRMKQNGKDVRTAYNPRGMIMATGENFPNIAESRMARSVIVEIEKGDLKLDLLSSLQGNTHKLNITMREYIRWITENYNEIKYKIKNNYCLYRNKFNKELSHARIPENIAALYIGCEMFFDFAVSKKCITNEICNDYKKNTVKALIKVANKQSLRTSDYKPDKMFFFAIQELLASGDAYFKAYLHEDATMSNPYSTFMGCYDTSCGQYYLIPGIAYKTVVQYYEKQNIKFPLNQSSLWAYLKKHGGICLAEKDRNTIRRRINNELISVIAVHQENISGDMGNTTVSRDNEEIILPF